MTRNVRFEVPVKFEAEEAFTFGVTNVKYGGYSVLVKFDAEGPQIALFVSTAEQNGAILKLYGVESSTVYFRCDLLTEKQKSDLLGAGIMIVNIRFEATGTYKKKDGSTELRLRVTRLRKVRVAERLKAAAPED